MTAHHVIESLKLIMGLVGLTSLALGFWLVFNQPVTPDQNKADILILMTITFILNGFVLTGASAHALSK